MFGLIVFNVFQKLFTILYNYQLFCFFEITNFVKIFSEALLKIPFLWLVDVL